MSFIERNSTTLLLFGAGAVLLYIAMDQKTDQLITASENAANVDNEHYKHHDDVHREGGIIEVDDVHLVGDIYPLPRDGLIPKENARRDAQR
jgi:hypothetical protein